MKPPLSKRSSNPMVAAGASAAGGDETATEDKVSKLEVCNSISISNSISINPYHKSVPNDLAHWKLLAMFRISQWLICNSYLFG